ncbi:hypothetical protein ABMA28_007000 [Loxostege sticticalis]|uniref:Uncharacterized protein n=1 Tax=Loxostege sticticalis TaxID=481309 RepID=A0ABD0TPA2_LOXSC
MDEEMSVFEPERTYEPISVCKCLIDQDSSESIFISERKKQILSTVARTESYLRERRIPELVRFLLTKLLSSGSNKPIIYLEKLLNDCMLFRAGHGVAPVLYENRHLEAVVKSFDPGQRGWLSAGQTRRAFVTLGLTPEEPLEDRIPCDVVLNSLRKTQETELYNLLAAGMNMPEFCDDTNSESY